MKAIIYRMDMTENVCPSGLRARDLLRRRGFDIDDRPFLDRAQVDAFKAEHNVTTTPQIWIGDERIGGYSDLKLHFGIKDKSKGKTYTPVLMLFAVSALLAMVLTYLTVGVAFQGRTTGWFISLAMVMLGLQKLMGLDGFVNGFLQYDLLAQRHVRYAYVYPFVETGAGLLMTAGLLTWLSAPVVLVVAGIGAISVFKAAYIDKRDLNCACVGGGRNVPLGAVSLTENVMMVGMALYMLGALVF